MRKSGLYCKKTFYRNNMNIKTTVPAMLVNALKGIKFKIKLMSFSFSLSLLFNKVQKLLIITILHRRNHLTNSIVPKPKFLMEVDMLSERSNPTLLRTKKFFLKLREETRTPRIPIFALYASECLILSKHQGDIQQSLIRGKAKIIIKEFI